MEQPESPLVMARRGTRDLKEATGSLIVALVDSWNRGDREGFARLFLENADYVTGSGIRLEGRGQIRRSLFPKGPASAATGRVSLLMESIKPLGTGAALILCTWMMGASGARRPRESSKRGGFMTIVTKRTDRGWRILSLQNTDRKL